MTIKPIYRAASALALALTSLAGTSSFAQTRTWTNSGTGSWFTNSNWSGNAVPTSANNVLIRSNGTSIVANGSGSANNITVGGGNGSNDGTLNIASTGALTANKVTVGGGFLSSANGTLNLEGLLTTASVSRGGLLLAPSGVFNFNGGTLRASASGELISGFAAGDVTINAGGATIDTNGFNSTIALPLGGAGGLTKVGSGTLVLTSQLLFILNPNSYSGGTSILEGTLQVGDGTYNASLGSGDVLNNSLLVFDPAGLGMTIGNAISGTGALQKIGNNLLTLTGSNTYTGATTISGGSLRVGDGGTTGSLGTGDVLNEGTLIFHRSDDVAFGGDIDGTGVLQKAGSGTLTLSGDSTYTGGTQISEGVLEVSSDANLGAANGNVDFTISLLNLFATNRGLRVTGTGFAMNRAMNITVLTEARLDIVEGTLTQNGAITGAGNLVKDGNGTLVLTAANSYGNFLTSTAINSGTLRVTNIAGLGNGGLSLNAGTFDPTGTVNVATNLNFNGGSIASTVGTTTDLVQVNNAFVNGGGTDFLIDFGAGATTNTQYTLLTFGNTDYVDPTVFQIANPDVTFDYTFDLQSNSLVLTIFSATASGAILQNSNPVDVPTFADFVVNGPVTTGSPSESNAINSLIFNNNSSLQVFNNLTVTSGTFNVLNGIANLFGGNIITPGDLNKLGLGKLITGSSIFVGGAANIQQGTFIVNGELTANGGVTVFQNAVLGGHGVINGNVTSYGQVSPGNSIGILTFNGDYVAASSGSFLLEIASTSSFDQLIVTGNASLAGVLQVSAGKLKYGQQYAFLHAASITGEFDSIVMPNPSKYRGRFLAEGGTGVLVVAPTSYTLVAETTNQQNVAKALDSYIPATSGDRETVSIALDLLTAEQYPNALDQIAPTFYESLANITIEQAVAQNQILSQRMSAARLGARGFRAVGIQSPLVHDKDGKSVLEAKDAKDGKDILTTTETKWGVWAQGNGMFSRVTNANQVPAYHFNGGGFLVGADYRWNDNFVTGLYAGYEGLYAKYSGGGTTTVNSALFGGYASYQSGGFYSDAIVGGGYNGYNVKRPINFSTVDRTARSQPNGGQFTTYLDAGYDWQLGNFTLGPVLGGQYTYAGIAPFSEDGADSLDLNVAQQNANSLRTFIGGRVAYTWNLTPTITIIPEVRLFWQHEFLNNPRNIGAALDNGNGPTFGYQTSAPDRDSVFAGGGVSAQFGKNWNAYFYYNADFGRQDYVGHIISTGVNLQF